MTLKKEREPANPHRYIFFFISSSQKDEAKDRLALIMKIITVGTISSGITSIGMGHFLFSPSCQLFTTTKVAKN